MFASGHGVYDAMKPETSAQINSGENQIVVYQPDETIRLDVRLENETVWLNRHQMAQLFGREVKTIGKHIVNALSEELARSEKRAFRPAYPHTAPQIGWFLRQRS